MLYYLNNPAPKGIIENQASRPDIYRGFVLSDNEEAFLTEQWHRTYQGIVDKMLNSDSYQTLYKHKTKFKRGLKSKLAHPIVNGSIGGIIAGIIIYLFGMN